MIIKVAETSHEHNEEHEYNNLVDLLDDFPIFSSYFSVCFNATSEHPSYFFTVEVEVPESPYIVKLSYTPD